MKTTRMICCVSVFLVGAAASAPGLDWPQWRGPNRDGKASGFDAPSAWPEALKRQWSVEVGDGVATPALVGDRMYVFGRQDGQEVTRCLDATTGREIWKDGYETAAADGPASGFAGPRSSPAVAQGKVVTYGVRGVLSCIDAETGEVAWRKSEYADSLPRFYTSSSPIIVDGQCVVQLGGEEGGAIAAFDLESGETRWKWAEDGTAYASPVLLTIDGMSILIAETDDHIVALETKTGKSLWQLPYAVSGRGYNAATPIVAGPMMIYTGSNRGAIAARFTKQGESLSTQELWTNQDNSVQYNSPVLKDGLVYGLSDRNVLFCIDAETGQTVWSDNTLAGGTADGGGGGGQRPQAGGQRDREGQSTQRGGGGRRGGRGGGGRGGYGSIVDAGSVLFALTPAGQLVVFQPSRTGFQQLASYKVAEEGTYAYPIIAGNRIFVKDANSVTLWSID